MAPTLWDRISVKFYMYRWILTGKCPQCGARKGHKMDCRLSERARDLM